MEISVKEQAEVFRLGLMIGIFNVGQVINWADSIIEKSDIPESFIIEISLSKSKGLNYTIEQLKMIKGIYNDTLVASIVIGLVYKRLNIEPVSEIARKLYSLAQNISQSSVGIVKYQEMIFMEDIFSLHGEESVTHAINNLFCEYEAYADEFNVVIKKDIIS